MDKDNEITKTQLYNELAKLTYEQYDLGDIKKIFPNHINILKNWRQYVDKNLSISVCTRVAILNEIDDDNFSYFFIKSALTTINRQSPHVS